jgi:hypothetical protein
LFFGFFVFNNFIKFVTIFSFNIIFFFLVEFIKIFSFISLLYLVFPIDLIPDAISIIGLLEDALFLSFSISLLNFSSKPIHRLKSKLLLGSLKI